MNTKVERFVRETKVPGVLGNYPASGTEIIKELGAEHVRTGKPIVYTSADSVFQIAAHEEVIPVPRLYEICEAARRLRGYARVRFQQGVLIDEVARELMLLRSTLCEFLWQEARGFAEDDARVLRDALRRAELFFDELVAEAILVYASSLRPVVPTRGSVWPPPRRRRQP